MKIGSSILALVLLFGATYYVLGSVTTNSSHMKVELRHTQERNRQLELQLQQQSQTYQRDIQTLHQNVQQLHQNIRSQQGELALLQQSLDTEREARVEAEQIVETLVQLINKPRSSLAQNSFIRSLAMPIPEQMKNRTKAILTVSLIVMVVVGGYYVRGQGRAKLKSLLRDCNRAKASTTVEHSYVWVRMTRQQCHEYSRWQRGKHQERYQTTLSQHECSVSN